MKQSSLALVLVLIFGLLVARCARAADPIRPDSKLTPGMLSLWEGTP